MLSFRTTGVGASGLGEYSFSLDLFSSVDGETSSFTVSDTSVNVVLMKCETGVWPRLTESSTQRLPWLRTDFDRLSPSVLKAMLAVGGNADDDDDDADESSDGEWKPRANVNFIRPSPEEILLANNLDSSITPATTSNSACISNSWRPTRASNFTRYHTCNFSATKNGYVEVKRSLEVKP
ncbi:unnamed protein product [Rodentolepis nana]|uniref:CS domain-containing protein n=1 Tax=Rodentolepis nana TaxID=102285 RepID=A0A0R3TNF4_RODNA|nr:unnamed protein product [Rodentolepis nana]